MEWGSTLLTCALETSKESNLDCQLFLHIFAGFTHSKLVEYERKTFHM